MTARQYIPWVRRGLAGAGTIDPLTGPVGARAEVTVTTAVNTGPPAPTAIQVYGPGDVLGFDTRHVIRREPAPDTPDAEPNYFPAIEFDRPELPWLFTPAAPNVDRLRPWIVLIAVRQDRATIDATAGRLPVLRVDDAQQELPNLDQSWAWAHAQVGAAADLLADPPVRALARLVCPRLLVPRTRYVAAVVPAFELGRRAGLGLAIDPNAATTAASWTNATTEIDLPMYVWWEFVTGQEGDFEALVSRLRRNGAGGTAATPIIVASLPAGIPDLGEWMMPGAIGACPDPRPPARFTDPLQRAIDGRPAADLVLPPPLYGRWHAAVESSSTASRSRSWVNQLNLDPRYRAAAALGTRIVQSRQEELMAAAWRQAGEIEAANALLRQGQLARGASLVLHGQIGRLSDAGVLHISTAIHTRVLAGATTVAAVVDASRVPRAMTSGAFRRATRPRGRLARRSRTSGIALLRAVNDGRLSLTAPAPRPHGSTTVDEAAAPSAIRFCEITSARVAQALAARHGQASPEQWRAFIAAAAAHQQGLPGCEPVPRQPRPALDLPALRTAILAATDPARTIPARVRARLTLPPGWNPEDPLAPVWAAPRFDTPVYRDLLDLTQEHMLPGIQNLPANSVTALPTNPRFVEALMVGVNHEMARELLWRGFPTDQRGTCFRRFWDRAASLAGPADDIPPIDTWTGDLGTHLTSGEQVVLVVRGEVLQRYPRTLIYAARATWSSGRRVPATAAPGAEPGTPAFPEEYPVFGGTIPPDITFFGFDLDPAEAHGNPDPAVDEPGWFFVFQQPPAEPRLGLDADATDPAEPSWPAVARTTSDHIDLAGGLTGATVAGWGVSSTSATLAALTEQRPFRICIHASDLLPAVRP
ncbi:MAG TPA: hypothetical protein VFK57_19025 [Vicinamibacterales bacterium]|nr:hypothetical protein [Vicinamibacterales bacterium]